MTVTNPPDAVPGPGVPAPFLSRPSRGATSPGAFWSALIPWVVARFIVLAALALARYLVGHLHLPAQVVLRVHEGLLGWDAGYYRDIAGRGYGALPRSALRFFPLVPLATRALHDLTRLPVGACLILISNGAALAAGVLLYRLVRRETGNLALARTAVWILAMAPSSFVLVMGYSEAPMILLALASFLALRSGRWWSAAATGYLAGLTRPVGVLLAVPAAIEALRRPPVPVERSGIGLVAGRLAAVAAPALGCLTYLGYVGYRFGAFLSPLRAQENANLRGGLSDPVSTVAHDLNDLFRGHIGTGLHVPWLIVFLALVVLALARWPASYGMYALATLGVAVSSSNFDSLERYALSAFPLVLAAAGVVSTERRQRVAFSLLGALLVSYALLAFLDALVP